MQSTSTSTHTERHLLKYLLNYDAMYPKPEVFVDPAPLTTTTTTSLIVPSSSSSSSSSTLSSYYNQLISTPSTNPILFTSILTVSSGVVLYFIQKWINLKMMEYNCYKKNEQCLREMLTPKYVRYEMNTIKKVLHHATCHCHRVHFTINAPKILHSVDVQSKIRFPRIVVHCNDFEMQSDEIALSMYPIIAGVGMSSSSNGEPDRVIGVHTFCSYCGMHILYSPSLDPSEIHINADCLDKSTVEMIHYAYYGTCETFSCPTNYEPANGVSRRGEGAHYVPAYSSLLRVQKMLDKDRMKHGEEEEEEEDDLEEKGIPTASYRSRAVSSSSTSSQQQQQQQQQQQSDLSMDWSKMLPSDDDLPVRGSNHHQNHHQHSRNVSQDLIEEEEDTTTEYFPSPTGSINGDGLEILLASTNHASGYDKLHNRTGITVSKNNNNSNNNGKMRKTPSHMMEHRGRSKSNDATHSINHPSPLQHSHNHNHNHNHNHVNRHSPMHQSNTYMSSVYHPIKGREGTF